MKWICSACREGDPCFCEINSAYTPDQCVLRTSRLTHHCDWVPCEQAAPESPQEPELFTGWDAIKLALKDGGEIWNEIENVFRCRIENEKITKYDSGVALVEKYYSVRPLTFGFDEAMERLKRGVSVKDSHGHVLTPVVHAKDSKGDTVHIDISTYSASERFTLAPE